MSLHPKRNVAFTLIEVMIAVAVSAIVLAAVNGIFWGALRLRTKTVSSIDAALPKEQALAIIRSDLANIVPPGGKFALPLQTTTPPTNTMIGMPTSSMPGQSSPEFTTSGGIIDDNTMWSDLQRVSYNLINSTNGAAGRDLYRTLTRNLLPALRQDVDQKVILGGVENIFFYYHDGTIWKQTWDTNETLRLPRAIKVQIEMAVQERGQLPPPAIEMVVPLIDAGTNVTQIAAAQ